MIADRLRAAILQAAISGKLTKQHPEDGTAEELLETIKTERQQLEKEGKIKKQKPLPPVDKTDEPFDLPDSWVWSRLGRVFNMQAGKNVAVGNISEVGEYPCYGGNGIRGYVADYNRDGTYPIIGRQGALCGNINVASGRFFATEHAVVVETFGHTSPAWAALALEQLNLNQYATATAQPGLSVEKLKVVPVPVPPVDEQERIVAKLDEVLPLIDQLAELEREREYLDREFAKAIERAILQAAISGKLTKQHPEDGTAEELLETIKTERQQLEKEGIVKKQKPMPSVDKTDEPFELPDTWKWAPVGSIVDLINGRAFKRQELQTSGKWPVLRVGNLFTNETWYYSDLDLEDDKYCSNGDLLYAWSASFGPHIWRGEKSIFHYHIWKVRHYSMNRGYLNYVLQWDVERIRTATTGSTMVHVSMTNMRPRTIPVAPIEEQDRIVKRLDSLLPLVDQIGKLVL